MIDIRDALFTGTAQIQAVRICQLAAKLLWQACNCGSKIQVLVVMDTGLGFSSSGQGHNAAIEACGLIAKLFQSRQLCLENTYKSKVVDSQQHNTFVASKQSSPDDNEALDASVYFLAKKQHKSGIHTVHLDQIAEWLLQQPSKQETVFWISAFDYCGEQFDQNVDLLFQRSKQVAIIVDDDVMRSGIPPGQYNYLSPQLAIASNNTASKNVSKKSILNRGASNALKNSLQIIYKNKEERFTKLMMPMFNIDEHGDNLLATLRHQGYLP